MPKASRLREKSTEVSSPRAEGVETVLKVLSKIFSGEYFQQFHLYQLVSFINCSFCAILSPLSSSWRCAGSNSPTKDDKVQNLGPEFPGLAVNPSFSGLYLPLIESKSTILSFTSILELYTAEWGCTPFCFHPFIVLFRPTFAWWIQKWRILR